MHLFKYEIGDQAWYRWDGWEVITILQRETRSAGNYYQIDLTSPGKWVHEDFLKD